MTGWSTGTGAETGVVRWRRTGGPRRARPWPIGPGPAGKRSGVVVADPAEVLGLLLATPGGVLRDVVVGDALVVAIVDRWLGA
jgi:hypothetical protein